MLNINKRVYLAICAILCFALSLFQVPSYAAASFADSVSVDAGIKLTLGNVNLDEAASDFKQSVMLSMDAPEQTLVTTTLQNAGSLDGTIGYKIEGIMPTDVAGGITLELYEGNEYIAALEVGTDSFLQKNGQPVVIEPGIQKTYSVKIKTATLPDATENIRLSISFSLTQTNATEPKKMFYDIVIFDPITVFLEGETANPDTGWPMDSDPRWKTDSKTGVRYINELETEIMYYSETKDGTRIKNLDNLSIYIDYGKSNQKWNLTQISKLDPPFKIKEEWSDGKVRIDVSLDADVNQYMHATTISDYDYDMKFQFQSNNNRALTFKGSLFAKRLLLTTDNADFHNNAEYHKDILPIYTSKQENSIHLAYIQNNAYSPLTSLSEAPLQLAAYRIRFNVQNANSLSTKVDQSSNSFKVKVADFVSDLAEIKRLTIFITGTSGEELKIERNVKALPIDVNMQIPTEWYDIGENRVKINTQQLDVQLIEQKEADGTYFVSDANNPPVLYLMNAGNHYFGFEYDKMWIGQEIKEIVYSPDMKVMRITFSFKEQDLQQNNNGKSFSFKISNGIGYMIYYHQIALNFIPASNIMSSQENFSILSGPDIDQEFSASESVEPQTIEVENVETDEPTSNALDIQNEVIPSTELNQAEEIVALEPYTD